MQACPRFTYCRNNPGTLYMDELTNTAHYVGHQNYKWSVVISCVPYSHGAFITKSALNVGNYPENNEIKRNSFQT